LLRDDVVRVVRDREATVTVEQIAKDFRGAVDDVVQVAVPGRHGRRRHARDGQQ
jgi:hypothetical protein